MDWSLLQSHAKHVLLRNELLYSNYIPVSLKRYLIPLRLLIDLSSCTIVQSYAPDNATLLYMLTGLKGRECISPLHLGDLYPQTRT